MAFSKSFSFTKLALFLSRVLKKHYQYQRGLQRNLSNAHITYSHLKLQRNNSSIPQTTPLEPSLLSNQTTLIFNVEGTLLKSSSLFSYFMLVAFEAGSIIRALFLLLLYPLFCFVNDELSLKIMVMVCFFGIKKNSFRVGRSVLPKFFLEDVGVEGFEALRRAQTTVGVSELPQVMVESFLKDYLEIDFVFGRQLKVVGGHYVGLMEDKSSVNHLVDKIFEDEKVSKNVIGLNNLNKAISHHLFSRCKEIYMVNEAEKKNWNILPRNRYPKPLIFHDGRLAFNPTPSATLAMFMWFPLGAILSIFRILVALSLPYNISNPILVSTGIKLRLSKPNHLKSNNTKNGLLYVCNHRTLLDPLFLSFGLKKPLAAVTYSLSRMSEILSPIRTVRLTRSREDDRRMMDKLLTQGDLVVCPEGTTCREPYLLRLSPLFTELSDNIVPVGMDTHVSMFHGTTAGGLKCLDPIFFLMNPCPSYTVRFLDVVCGASSCNDGTSTRFEVANNVQSELGKVLGFECTSLTRKDKYLILAGNEGIVADRKQ